MTGSFTTALLLFLLSSFSVADAAIVVFESDGFVRQVESSSAQKLSLDWPSILRTYEEVEGHGLWHDGDNSLNESGRQLYAWLAEAEAEGLNPDDYHLDRLKRLEASPLSGGRVLRELLLTDAYLRLAADLRQGNRSARLLNAFWGAQAEAFDPVFALREALAQRRLADLLGNLSPRSDDYARLRQALARYRQIEQRGGWSRLEAALSLRPGERHPQVARLRERLAVEAGWERREVKDPDHYDPDLVAAVEGFQVRHGLEPDGVVGPATLEALNVPVSTRVAQLRANLERWRWLPHELEPDHILVNTAGFQIAMRSQQEVVFSGRTVNGRAERQTPALISRVTHLVANPEWTLPRRIAVEDILPRQQQDPEYMSRQKIRVHQRIGGDLREVDPRYVEWSRYHEDNFPFILRQDAGPGNSLGRIKFHLPNREAIFLHDTPAVGLFKRSQRALSSGCVRVKGADRLASLLISRADPEDEARFIRAMETGETLWVPLAEPVPVYLTYFTSWVDEAGEVHFRPDIYRRDTDLMMAFAGETDPVTAQGPPGREPVRL